MDPSKKIRLKMIVSELKDLVDEMHEIYEDDWDDVFKDED